jgi:hypothetical protein
MDAVSAIEPDCAFRKLVRRALSVWCRRLQRAFLKVDDDHVLVVEVHRRRHPGAPRVVPQDDAIVLEQLLRAGARKRKRISRRVSKRYNARIFEIDHDDVGARGGTPDRHAF